MSEVKTFLRYCPARGKRFHIKLVSKKLVRDDREERVKEKQASYDGLYGTPMNWANPGGSRSRHANHGGGRRLRVLIQIRVWTEMQHRETDVK